MLRLRRMKKRRGLGIAIRNEKGELMGAMATPAYSRFVLSFGLWVVGTKSRYKFCSISRLIYICGYDFKNKLCVVTNSQFLLLNASYFLFSITRAKALGDCLVSFMFIIFSWDGLATYVEMVLGLDAVVNLALPYRNWETECMSPLLLWFWFHMFANLRNST